jgi:hypothetical protein
METTAANPPLEPRRTYEPPRLRRISLRADEVLSVGCKLGSGPGPFGATCDAVPCNQPGS